MEICKGLSYAHEMLSPDTGRPLGIVHRDISPPNVLISKQGEVKVVDFGLAKATSQIETTDPGVVKGKMSYLSPEAARGEEVDSRADIFAVGILLYEMLTGKRLFYGETDYQTVELVRNAKIPPLRPQNPQVEPELEDVVRKALARRADDRYTGATDLQDALAHYSYSRGLKVIARDIAELVRQCLDDARPRAEGTTTTTTTNNRKPAGSIIDTILQNEIVKFTSVDFEDPGARPLSPDDLSPSPAGSEPGHSMGGGGGDFIDPRGWASERMTPVVGIDQIEGLDRRDTVADTSSIVQQAMEARDTMVTRGAMPFPTSPAPGLTGPTPGPESLANVLEPGMPPVAAPAPAPRPEIAKARRSFLIGAAIGLVLLAITMATVVARRGGHPEGATPATAPQH
jgi:serine/threonine protein kinase